MMVKITNTCLVVYDYLLPWLQVIEVSRDDDAQTNIYLVHYNGWNNR